MNINILVQNASSIVGTTLDAASRGINGTTTIDDVCATTTDNNYTSKTQTTGDDEDGKLSPMAVHFLAVGALFVAVLLLAAVNAYLHFRSQRRRRMFLAPPPPVERYMQPRRSRRGGSSVSTGEDLSEQSSKRPRMTMRMKPTKMFTGSVSN